MTDPADTPDWLRLDDAAAPKKRGRGRPPGSKNKTRNTTPTVAAAAKLTRERSRAPSMQRRLVGKDRIWACDGEYVYFRPFRYVNGVRTEVANPTTYDRHRRFLAAGHYEYVETQDDVQVFRVLPASPFARKGMYLGEMSDFDVRRQIILAACRRDWPTYVDALEELAGRIKNQYDTGMAKSVYDDHLTYIENAVRMRGGPTTAEMGAGLQGVRSRRGHDRGRLILAPT